MVREMIKTVTVFSVSDSMGKTEAVTVISDSMKKTANSVEELEVFKKAHKITVEIYEITKAFPQDEKFALVSQMRRAAYSIPSNLMEGGHRLNKKEYRQFAGIAKGSVGELKYFLLLSKDLGYISEKKFFILRESAEEVSKMLGGLVKSLTDTGAIQ